MMRSHYCGEVDEKLVGQTVEICGWVHHRRDHGGVIFLDVRDIEGIVQLVYEPENNTSFTAAELIRGEYVIRAKGIVRKRPDGMVNSRIRTGQIEILGQHCEILSAADTPPFSPSTHDKTSEDVRNKHRYLYLRTAEAQKMLVFRAKAVSLIRQYLESHRFLDIETPMLTKATPEGARDYLVPSRVHPGHFYALPQSPQLFKQLLMVAGFDRYYQVVRCFRDEDLRADRQPEFTQIDIETSFMNEEDIQNVLEGMMKLLFKEMLGVELPQTFPRMTYAEAMRRFGSDKPDLRIDLELVDIADLVNKVDFQVFSDAAKSEHGRVVALRLPAATDLSRKSFDDYAKFVSIYGAKGLAYIKVNSISQGMEGLQSPILKFLGEDVVNAILARLNAQDGDVIFFGAGRENVVNESMGALRIKLGHDRGLINAGWQMLWVIDWPSFEDPDGKGVWQPLHHPFTAPNIDDPEALKANPGKSLSRAYDLVLNGIELGGGSIRIHTQAMQKTVFDILRITEEEADEKFGFLLEALRFGAPPHGGIALGLDRMIMLMAGGQSIREVIAFPKTQTASCPLTNAPSTVSIDQLVELSISVRKKEPK